MLFRSRFAVRAASATRRGFSRRPGRWATPGRLPAPRSAPRRVRRPGFAAADRLRASSRHVQWAPWPTLPCPPVASPPRRRARRPVQECAPAVHRLRWFGLGLGPTNPELTTRAQEPSGFRWRRLSRRSLLLVPAFSLPRAPAVLPLGLPRKRGILPYHAAPQGRMRGFGGVLASPVGLSARDDSTSELLRTLSMVAASEPTSWLSGPSHILSHSARTPGP